MFQIVCDPSSGSAERAGLKLLVIFFVCVVGVWQRNFEPAVCVHGSAFIIGRLIKNRDKIYNNNNNVY